MRYMLMLMGEEPNWEDIDPAEMQATIDAMGRYNEQLREAGVLLDGAGLRERATATCVRFEGTGSGDGETIVSDGPFAETKEQLMGYWVLGCETLDEALEWTKQAPLGGGTTIEVRPLVEDAAEDDISGDELLRRVQEKPA